MIQPSLIIITGLPGTGKSTLGKKIAKEFNLPFICKDEIKELLFDSLGWQDREWSKKMGASSYDLLYYITETLLRARKSLIIETNFNPKFANKKLLDLKERYNFTPLQIRCVTDGEVLFDRFKKRAQSKERHPGHADNENLEEWRLSLSKGKIEPLSIGGEFFDFDTTDLKKIDENLIFSAVRSTIDNMSTS